MAALTPIVIDPAGFRLPDAQRRGLRWTLYIGYAALTAGVFHGLANALIFPHVLAFNAPVASQKTETICSLLQFRGEGSQAVLAAGLDYCRHLGIETSLAAHGASGDDLPSWAAEAHAIRRLMDNNPRPMSVDDVLTIYQAAMA